MPVLKLIVAAVLIMSSHVMSKGTTTREQNEIEIRITSIKGQWLFGSKKHIEGIVRGDFKPQEVTETTNLIQYIKRIKSTYDASIEDKSKQGVGFWVDCKTFEEKGESYLLFSLTCQTLHSYKVSDINDGQSFSPSKITYLTATTNKAIKLSDLHANKVFTLPFKSHTETGSLNSGEIIFSFLDSQNNRHTN